MHRPRSQKPRNARGSWETDEGKRHRRKHATNRHLHNKRADTVGTLFDEGVPPRVDQRRAERKCGGCGHPLLQRQEKIDPHEVCDLNERTRSGRVIAAAQNRVGQILHGFQGARRL